MPVCSEVELPSLQVGCPGLCRHLRGGDTILPLQMAPVLSMPRGTGHLALALVWSLGPPLVLDFSGLSSREALVLSKPREQVDVMAHVNNSSALGG